MHRWDVHVTLIFRLASTPLAWLNLRDFLVNCYPVHVFLSLDKIVYKLELNYTISGVRKTGKDFARRNKLIAIWRASQP